MLQPTVAVSATLSSAVAISVVSWAIWALLNPASPNTRCCLRISWYLAAKCRLKFVHVLSASASCRHSLHASRYMPVALTEWNAVCRICFAVNGFSCHRHTALHHWLVGKRRQYDVNYLMLRWCMLHWFWDRRLWCCRIDTSDDRVDLVLSRPYSRCTHSVICSHTDFQLHPEVVSWVHHPCWRDWCICVVPLYVDHGVVDGLHWLPLVGRPALLVVQRVWCTLLGIRSRIVLPSWLRQRGCVICHQGWW